MQHRTPVSVLIATKNEARNIGKCLRALEWADEVIVVDSASTDGTAEIVRSAGRGLVQFRYQGGYPKKRQWALDTLPLRNSWILLLDADEEVTPELAREIATAIGSSDVAGYFIVKQFHFLGRRMRHGGFSHAALLLLRKGAAVFERIPGEDQSGFDMEVHERLLVQGATRHLGNPLVHHDFKGLTAYLDRHNRYSTWEAQFRVCLMRDGIQAGQIQPRLFGDMQQRRRLIKKLLMLLPFEPWLWFMYHYVFRLGFLEGRRGLIAARIRRAHFEQVRAKIYEMTLTATEK